MSNTSSKIELLYMINELKEHGDIKNVMKLQKIFLESLSEDRQNGKYNVDIQLDRKDKKVISEVKTTLTKNLSGR
ncbi:hypothetical protein [Methylocucumis oryzae]|uniref:Uncharacterized protein n=1 Tax=Methylocucumis oryzae TaxID=1632867 RepID=A0A0F3IEU0_9GAMM|nr:hypothetical protein [Methylocucumis oryzae]KJV05043.1 hypothetical protein VZ94_21015 [Methylocucumis oryzae]